MKKIFISLLVSMFVLVPAVAKTDRTSLDYLKSKKHIALMNPFAESIAERVIKKSLIKETGGKYKVKFEGYTLKSMKQGIFKNLEITGKNINADGIEVPYVYLKSESDYNWVDYTKDPIQFKSDMEFSYNMKLTEDSVNTALKHKEYRKVLQKVNKRAYPLFSVHDVQIRVRNNKVYVIMDYNLPLASVPKNKTFMVSTNFKVDNGKIKASNIGINSAYGNLPIDKVTNLINLLDPLSFTLGLMNENKCNGKIENVKIEDNIIQINGKIYVAASKV